MGRPSANSGLALLAALSLSYVGTWPSEVAGQKTAPTTSPPARLTISETPPTGKLPAEVGEELPPPGKVGASNGPAGKYKVAPNASLPDTWDAMPISLMAALRLAQSNHLDIAQARQVLTQAQANLLRAQISWLPNFNIGSTYTYHQGNAPKAEGNIIKTNKDSLFVGGGPSATFALTDAIFAPLVARQIDFATQAGLQRVNNDSFLAVADAYFSVLRARRRLARVDETLEFLTADRPSPARAQSKGLLPLVQNFVEAGGKEALKSELYRVRVEVMRRQEERAAALQDLRIAAAEVARLVRLDPTIPLWPVEDFRYPLSFPGDQWSTRPLEELVDVAMNNRPELAENRALVQAALRRYQAAKARPFLPTFIVNYSWGDFGGAPNLYTLPGKTTTYFGGSGDIRHFGTRSDFDATLVWRLQNMGAGDLAAIREQAALHRQAQFRALQIQDRVIADIVQTYEAVQGWRQRVEVTGRALFDDKGAPRGPVFEGMRLNFLRIRTDPGTRALEVLDSIRGLNDLLDAYAQAVTEYERARFRLLIALGLPAQNIFSLPQPDPAAGLPPNPVKP